MTAPRFEPAAIDAAKRNIRLSSIIGARVTLAGVARDELVGRCPFLMEKTPSFTVNDAKGFRHRRRSLVRAGTRCRGLMRRGGVFPAGAGMNRCLLALRRIVAEHGGETEMS